MPGTTATKLSSKRKSLRFEGIDLKRSIGLASGLGNSVGKNGTIGSCPIKLKKIRINEPSI
jgi:hypothetical protein